MSAEEEDSEDKEHEASPQKLIEARKKGDIPRSADLLMAIGISGFLLALLGLGGWVVTSAGTTGMVLLDQSDRLAQLMVTGAAAPLGAALWGFLLPPMALLLVPSALVLAFTFATRSFLVTPDRIVPKLSRISLIATAKHKFGAEGLMEFAKGTAKLCLVSVVLYAFLAARIEEILGTVYLTPALSVAVLSRLTLEFLSILALLSLLIGGGDYLWQMHLHRQRNRMSRKELMDEFKESEGDPHMKAARRQRAQDVATNRMLSDVAGADVVIVNPTHYAVALKWDRTKGRAPVCVAKGVDEIARVIRARAADNGVPIHSDPPTARALHATVDLGQEIRSEHYRAVAASIRFADAMRRKAGRR